jgi:starch synthase (maltosyl-transferring)
MAQAESMVILDKHGVPLPAAAEETKLPPFQPVIIEGVSPEIDGGRNAIKREVGDRVTVGADIFAEGHGLLAARLRYRKKGQYAWYEAPMRKGDNERWAGSFTVAELGRYQYTIHAYPDVFRTWLEEVRKKHQAGLVLTSELAEGRKIIDAATKRAEPVDRVLYAEFLKRLDAAKDQRQVLEIVGADGFLTLMDRYADRSHLTEYTPCLEVTVDRIRARYAAWYEMFPRSQGRVQGKSGTFKDCELRLPDIKSMGFDVIYFPPIHPIGETNRKGPNNSLVAGPDDPGCPYAIGNKHGGHKSIEPGLGTLADFERFVRKCHEMGMEVALDFAIQCAPDHPYVAEHPEWFLKRPDGSIKYAENPPKKYEDIYPLNFYCQDWQGLWNEMKNVIEFWILHGVNIFRVDNPHTKPVAFWAWLIESIQAKHPQVVFLAEAFTHPKMMRALAKVGFTQSYTYFTWRNYKHELIDYFTELTQGPMQQYFRGNLFTNTPDILPAILQEGGRPVFKMRVTLAATLSSVYGIYSGFELCENKALPGREEYLDSEKYQYKVWDWNRPRNIKRYVATLNQIRQENPALREYNNLEFYHAENDNIIAYGKHTPNKDNIIIVIVNLDPGRAHDSFVYIPIATFGIQHSERYQVLDLITGARFQWQGERNYVRLDPHVEVAHILRLSCQ